MVSFYVQHRRKAFRGGGALWTPSSLPLALYLDANAPTTLFNASSGGSNTVADGTVVRWEDRSGNLRHAISSGTANRRVSALNGTDTIQVNSATQFFSHPVPVADPDNLTIAALFLCSNSSGGSMIWSHRSEVTRLLCLYVFQQSVYWDLRGSGNVFQSMSGAAANNQWHIAVATLNIPTNTHQLRINGVLVGTNNYNFGSQTLNSSLNWIGNQNTGSNSGQNLLGQYSKLLLSSQTLSLDSIERIEGWMAHETGLAATKLPSNHPYRNSPPYL
jgi:hypothetical protein